MRYVKPFAALVVLAVLISLCGCATTYYPKYAEEQGKAAVEHAKTDKEIAKGYTEAMKSDDATLRGFAAAGFLDWAKNRKIVQVEQCRPSPIEEGFGRMIPSVPGLLAQWGIVATVAGQDKGTTYQQTVTDGSSGNIGPGSSNLGTAAPYVVKPEVVSPEVYILE